MMTEDEAKTKWCPFTRYGGDSASTCNRYIMMVEPLRPEVAAWNACIGRGCMAWRWSTNFNQLQCEFPDKSGDDLFAIASGYCGLAGKP